MAKRKIIKLINGAESLLLLNGKESSRMAAKKKSKRAPAKRSAGRKHNPPAHQKHTRRARRRHNPETVFGQAVAVVAGSMATNIVAGYATSAFPQLGASPAIRIIGKAAIAFGLGKAVEKFAPAGFRSSGKFVALGGYANAATDAVNLVFPNLQTIFLPGGGAVPVQVATSAQPENGMADIVSLPRGTDDPYFGSTPSFEGLNDIVSVNEQYF